MGSQFKSHSICDADWKRQHPNETREPHRVRLEHGFGIPLAVCCYCGESDTSGIFIRDHVDNTPHCECD